MSPFQRYIISHGNEDPYIPNTIQCKTALLHSVFSKQIHMSFAMAFYAGENMDVKVRTVEFR